MQEYYYEIRDLAGVFVRGGRLRLRHRPSIGEEVWFRDESSSHPEKFYVVKVAHMANQDVGPLLVLVPQA